MMKYVSCVLLVLTAAAVASATPGGVEYLAGSATLTGSAGYNLFYGGFGAQTMDAPQGSQNRFVYALASDSDTVAHDHILSFDPASDVIDVSQICRSEFHETCSGPYPILCNPKCFDKGAGAVYYQYIPERSGWYTAVFGDFEGVGHPDFYIAIEGGRLALGQQNFWFGGK